MYTNCLSTLKLSAGVKLHAYMADYVYHAMYFSTPLTSYAQSFNIHLSLHVCMFPFCMPHICLSIHDTNK